MSDMTAEIDRAVQTTDGAADMEGAGQTPAETSPAVEGSPEPRSGEFEITEAPRSGELEVTETPAASESAQASGEPAPVDRQAAS
jgi:hypothetical protein